MTGGTCVFRTADCEVFAGCLHALAQGHGPRAGGRPPGWHTDCISAMNRRVRAKKWESLVMEHAGASAPLDAPRRAAPAGGGKPIVLTAPLTEIIDHAGYFIQMSMASLPMWLEG